MQLPFGNEGDLNGGTPVDVVIAPAVGDQRVIPVAGVTCHNADSVSHTYTFQKVKGGSTYVVDVVAGVASGGVAKLTVPVTLDDVDEKLQVKYETTKTTTESTFNVSGLDLITPAS